MILLVGHEADACGASINGMTSSTDDADFATCVKLSRVGESPVN